MKKIKLYHTGFDIIKEPDITKGRKNADFGQGFYMSTNEEFSRKWGRARKESKTYVNFYELELSSLKVKNFSRDSEWFDYIFRNRNGYEDSLKDFDVIIGPIANDTIYDTYGIITSGYLTNEQALKLLEVGPSFEQLVIKSEKALACLNWQKAEIIPEAELTEAKNIIKKEEENFQKAFLEMLDEMGLSEILD